MIPVTPEDAQCSLNYAEKYDSYLAVGYRRALETIANMREEWGVSYRLDRESGNRTTWGWDTREDAERAMRQVNGAYIYGIVRRYVTNEEEA